MQSIYRYILHTVLVILRACRPKPYDGATAAFGLVMPTANGLRAPYTKSVILLGSRKSEETSVRPSTSEGIYKATFRTEGVRDLMDQNHGGSLRA